MYASFRSVTAKKGKILPPTRTGIFFVDLNGPGILRDGASAVDMPLLVHRSTCSLSAVVLVLVVLIDRCNVFLSPLQLFSRKHRVLLWSNLKSFQLRNRYSEINSNTKLSANITQKMANYYHYFFRFLTLSWWRVGIHISSLTHLKFPGEALFMNLTMT